jgi:hypothetical protein
LILLAFSLFCFVFLLFFLVSVLCIFHLSRRKSESNEVQERKTQDNNLTIHEKCYRRKYYTDLLLCVFHCVLKISQHYWLATKDWSFPSDKRFWLPAAAAAPESMSCAKLEQWKKF